MASAQSSQDTRRGRGPQPQTSGNVQPRHRSESRRLSNRRRTVKTVARERDHCPGSLDEGDAVRVFSRSADEWVDGVITQFAEGSFVRVEYEARGYWCGKTVHVRSDHLIILSATAVMLEEGGDLQHPMTLSSDLQSPSPPRVEPRSDPRWLLSCKYDAGRQFAFSRSVQLIEMILGEDVVSNPNRFSKTCCTIFGEEWDDNYNQGEHAQKYIHCWEPNAPEQLQCTKPVAVGQEPTRMTCWKSSYFWRLKKSRKMLRVVEGQGLGDGQEIEASMAEFLKSVGGCEVRIIEIDSADEVVLLPTGLRDLMELHTCRKLPAQHVHDHRIGEEGDGYDIYLIINALHLATKLADAGFGCPYVMARKTMSRLGLEGGRLKSAIGSVERCISDFFIRHGIVSGFRHNDDWKQYLRKTERTRQVVDDFLLTPQSCVA